MSVINDSILYSKAGHNLQGLFSVRNKHLPTCPPRVEFAGGKLSVSEGCPLDNLKL